MKKIAVGGVYFTILCDHPYLVSLLFAVLLSQHLTYDHLMFFSLVYVTQSAAGSCLSKVCHQSESSKNSVLTGLLTRWLKNH